MYNSFLHRQLICLTILFFSIFSSISSQQELFNPRSLDLTTSLNEGLFHQALSGIDPYTDMSASNDLDRSKVISLLHTRYPELTYELERAPKQTLQGAEISKLLVQILKEESAAGVVDVNDSFWGIVESTDLDKKEQSTFKFLYAYELFKQKRFLEADKIFEKIIKERKGEYEYAFYYSGLIALIDKDYEDAHKKLKKIGQEKELRSQTPYYLAAAHYGQKNYHEVIKFYGPRIGELGLANVTEMSKIVAYAQFKTGDYLGSIASLNHLKKQRDLSVEESYLLGIAYQKSGDDESSSSYLSGIASIEGDLSTKAAYEHALNLADQGKNHEALAKFEELLTSGKVDKTEVIWNLAILNGRIENYDKLAFHATQLMSTPKQVEATNLLTKVLDNLDNDLLYNKIVVALNKNLKDKSLLKSSVYHKATAALKSDQKSRANKYFNLLSEIDPFIEERGVVAGWRGIMAYEEGDIKRAIRLLTNYQATRTKNATPTQLDFDASYFLAYSHFKLKDHSTALGHFSKAYEYLDNDDIRKVISQVAHKQEDINLRLGDSYFLLDEYDGAQRAYNRIIQSHSRRKDYALWQNATIAELENRPYDQILILDEIISDYSNGKYFNRAKFNTANTLFALNKYDKAATFYQDLIDSKTPQRMKEESIMQLGLISVNAGTYTQAEGYFKNLIDHSQDEDIVQRSHVALKEIYADYTYNTDAYLDLIAHNSEQKNDQTDRSEALFALALENSNKGKSKEAIAQWTKLIKDYPSSPLVNQSLAQLTEIYESQELWSKAFSTLKQLSQTDDAKQSNQAFAKAEAIVFEKMKDYHLYLEIVEDRQKQFPDMSLTSMAKYNISFAQVETKDLELPLENLSELLSDKNISQNQKRSFFNKLSLELIKKDQWSQLIETYADKNVALIIKKNPKLIYQRALTYFNTNDLEKAEKSITDYYDALLQEPAWLAKGIILISDIYVLQDDKDNASVALEALINSDSNIPPSLIRTAKERMKALKLQN